MLTTTSTNQQAAPWIGNFPDLFEQLSVVDPETGQRRGVREGDILKRPTLAKTLRTIAERGAEEFYTCVLRGSCWNDTESTRGSHSRRCSSKVARSASRWSKRSSRLEAFSPSKIYVTITSSSVSQCKAPSVANECSLLVRRSVAACVSSACRSSITLSNDSRPKNRSRRT